MIHTALMAVAILILVSCAQEVKKTTQRPAKATASKAGSLIKEGRFEEAARGLSSKHWQRFSSKRDRAALYSAAVNGLIDKGDTHMKAEEFGKAGESYRKSLDYYPADDLIAKRVKLTRKQLNANIGKCSNALMEAGLLKYRAGQLEEAIDIWKGIIVFDPGNAEAKKALDTATIQLRNLRKLR